LHLASIESGHFNKISARQARGLRLKIIKPILLMVSKAGFCQINVLHR